MSSVLIEGDAVPEVEQKDHPQSKPELNASVVIGHGRDIDRALAVYLGCTYIICSRGTPISIEQVLRILCSKPDVDHTIVVVGNEFPNIDDIRSILEARIVHFKQYSYVPDNCALSMKAILSASCRTHPGMSTIINRFEGVMTSIDTRVWAAMELHSRAGTVKKCLSELKSGEITLEWLVSPETQTRALEWERALRVVDESGLRTRLTSCTNDPGCVVVSCVWDSDLNDSFDIYARAAGITAKVGISVHYNLETNNTMVVMHTSDPTCVLGRTERLFVRQPTGKSVGGRTWVRTYEGLVTVSRGDAFMDTLSKHDIVI